MQIRKEDETFNTWMLIIVAAFCDLIFRLFLNGLVLDLDRPFCAKMKDYWLYEENGIPNIFDQFRYIWGMLAVLGALEAMRCILFKWTQRGFILFVNLSICIICSAMLYYFDKANTIFAYERGEIPFEQVYFQPRENMVPYNRYDYSYLTKEFHEFHYEQCRLRIEQGAPNGSIKASENAELFKSLGGKIYKDNAPFTWEKDGYPFDY